MTVRRFSSALGLLALVLTVSAGCSAAPAEEEGDLATGAVTPGEVTNVFDQVKVCDNLFSETEAFRQADLQEGVLRWRCGDGAGVTVSKCEDDLALRRAEDAKKTSTSRGDAPRPCDAGYGQELCEYNAVVNGSVINGLKPIKDTDTVQCVFTSVHSDFKGAGAKAFAEELASKVKSQLVGATSAPEGRVTVMAHGANSRAAADTLISDCANLARTGAKLAKDAERQVLCYKAFKEAKAGAQRSKLEAACGNVDLSDEGAWAKVGIAQGALTDKDKDLVACTMVSRDKTTDRGVTALGMSWRGSDASLCARSYRAASECKVTFNKIAPSRPGFSMQGWTNRATLPVGCKYATVDNQPFAQIVLCTPSPQDVKSYRSQKKPLQALCDDKFGSGVAVQAPIGALANLAGAKEETPFCKELVGGARKAQLANKP